MTRHVVRAYAATAAVLVFFLAWAVIAADPWSSSRAAVDPRVTALHARELQIRHQAVAVRRVVRHRWAVYRIRLAQRRHEISVASAAHALRLSTAQAAAPRAGAPPVSVVSLPPITVTRTS